MNTPIKILVVDDEKGFLSLMGDVLTGLGYDIIQAEDGKQAREIVDSEPVDLIISDIFMPTMDGFRFHSYVREFSDGHDIPFIFVSGYDDERTRGAIVDPELDYFFPKSTPVENILSLIEKLANERKPA